MQYFVPVFLTGFFTGGISCMAVQGGLLAAVLANASKQTGPRSSHIPLIFAFISAKIIAYTLLGFILGFIGSFFQMSPVFSGIILLLVSLFMIATALNLLNVHPIFRYAAITPPRFLSRYIRGQTKHQDVITPGIVGAMTIFLPCGTTQAIMAQAIGLANPWLGAGILLAFTLGTVPLFLFLGVAMNKTAQIFSKYFAPIAAVFIIGLALLNLSNAVALVGLTQTVQTAIRPLYCQLVYCEDESSGDKNTRTKTTDTPTITVNATSYHIDNPYIQAGSRIRLHIVNLKGAGCIQLFTIPKLGIARAIPMGESADITFTAPTKKGSLTFMCSMGMYRGNFIVQ